MTIVYFMLYFLQLFVTIVTIVVFALRRTNTREGDFLSFFFAQFIDLLCIIILKWKYKVHTINYEVYTINTRKRYKYKHTKNYEHE